MGIKLSHDPTRLASSQHPVRRPGVVLVQIAGAWAPFTGVQMRSAVDEAEWTRMALQWNGLT